ncbi:MAG: glycosyltransferase family 2 protein [Chloroflexaceae bacterium]|nr:glycosyltransferase family 2 protein [Chloroflexaceae bacterium]
MSRVVVLVLAWNGVDYLRPCLQALAHQQGIDSYGVLVVDNGSTDGSAELVEHEFPDVALLRLPSNLGFAAGNNAGIRALLAGQAPLPLADTPPDIVVLLNQDTEVAPDWLAQLVAVFEAQAQAGIVGCKIFFPDGTTLQHTGGSLHWPLATPEHRGTGKTDSAQYDTVGHVEYVTGAAMAIRSVVLREVGLLDEGSRRPTSKTPTCATGRGPLASKCCIHRMPTCCTTRGLPRRVPAISGCTIAIGCALCSSTRPSRCCCASLPPPKPKRSSAGA